MTFSDDLTRFVAAVLGELKRLIRTGAHGYGESSLDFRNAILDVDKFEERARRLRQRALRLRGAAPKRLEATTARLPDGSTVTRLAADTLNELPDGLHVGPRAAAKFLAHGFDLLQQRLHLLQQLQPRQLLLLLLG